MKLVWSPRAIQDLTHIVAYISRDSQDSASRVAARILSHIELLQDNPEIGRHGHDLRSRQLPISGLPYTAVYQITPDAVRLIRIRHTSQNWPR